MAKVKTKGNSIFLELKRNEAFLFDCAKNCWSYYQVAKKFRAKFDNYLTVKALTEAIRKYLDESEIDLGLEPGGIGLRTKEQLNAWSAAISTGDLHPIEGRRKYAVAALKACVKFKNSSTKRQLRSEAFEQFRLAAEVALGQNNLMLAAEIFNQALRAECRLGRRPLGAGTHRSWTSQTIPHVIDAAEEKPYVRAVRPKSFTNTREWKVFGRAFFRKRDRLTRFDEQKMKILFAPLIEQCLVWRRKKMEKRASG